MSSYLSLEKGLVGGKFVGRNTVMAPGQIHMCCTVFPKLRKTRKFTYL